MILRHLLCILAALTAACSATGEKTPDENGQQGQTGTTEEQTTPAAPTYKAFSFIQLSDTQLGFQTGNPLEFTEDTLALDFMVKQINRLKPAFVLNTGDMTDNSTNQSQIGAYKKVIARLDPSIPLHHLPGNHDVGSACSKAKVAAYEQRKRPR